MFLSMEGIIGYYLFYAMINVKFDSGEKIFMYLCAITLLLGCTFCVFEHFISWRVEIWSVIEPCLIGLRLRGIKKVFDFGSK